ncbi:integrase core domain-containing protein, partial [Leptonema illini]
MRRELTDHVIPLSENHLRSLVREYIRYYNEDRTHSSLGRDSPHGRLRAEMPPDRPLISVPRVRGLHHRYFPMEKVGKRSNNRLYSANRKSLSFNFNGKSAAQSDS